MFVSSVIYPVTIYQLMEKFISFAMANQPAASLVLAEQKKSLFIILSLWQIGFIGLVFIIFIFFTHNVDGPIYKIKMFINSFRTHHTVGKLVFRKHDYFNDVADEFNKMIEYIQDTHKRDFLFIEEVNGYLKNISHDVDESKQEKINKITDRLDEVLNRYGN